ncbi:MAG: transposase [Chloroflexia bacterium]|nr:transposase [Chloroflexia bacterium]
MFDHRAETLPLLYKYRWNMEILFKRLKSNFELTYFYSDSPEGIKTQIWIVLIAHLLFSVIHKSVKEAEQFTTLVAMAANNLGSYICFISLIKTRTKLTSAQRNLKLIQLEMFVIRMGGDFNPSAKSP